MPLGYCDTNKITAIADSIRSKTGKTDSMTLAQIPTEIDSITTGGVEPEILLTPLEGVDSKYADYKNLKLTITLADLSTIASNNSEITNTDDGYNFSIDFDSIKSEGIYATTDSAYDYFFGYCIENDSVSSGHLIARTYYYGVTAEVLEFKNIKVNFSKLFYYSKDDSSSGSASGTLNGTSYSGTATFYDYYYRGTVNKLIFNNCKPYGTTMNNFISAEAGSTTSSFYIKEIDFGNLDTSSITSMTDAFNTSALTTLTLSENWGSNTSLKSMSLSLCSQLTHDSCLDVFNKLATRTTSATLKLNSTTKALMSADEIKIATDKGWTVS